MVGSKRKEDTLGAALGRRISERRDAFGWTQAQLAERVGVDTETISRFERGAAMPSLARLQAVASVLKTSPSELLSEERITQPDDVTVLGGLLSGLAESDRKFLIAELRRACDHFRVRANKRI